MSDFTKASLLLPTTATVATGAHIIAPIVVVLPDQAANLTLLRVSCDDVLVSKAMYGRRIVCGGLPVHIACADNCRSEGRYAILLPLLEAHVLKVGLHVYTCIHAMPATRK